MIGCNSNNINNVQTCSGVSVYVCVSTCKSGYSEKYVDFDACPKLGNLMYCENNGVGDQTRPPKIA